MGYVIIFRFMGEVAIHKACTIANSAKDARNWLYRVWGRDEIYIISASRI